LCGIKGFKFIRAAVSPSDNVIGLLEELRRLVISAEASLFVASSFAAELIRPMRHSALSFVHFVDCVVIYVVTATKLGDEYFGRLLRCLIFGREFSGVGVPRASAASPCP
jgi:hypothetical protein